MALEVMAKPIAEFERGRIQERVRAARDGSAPATGYDRCGPEAAASCSTGLSVAR